MENKQLKAEKVSVASSHSNDDVIINQELGESLVQEKVVQARQHKKLVKQVLIM